MSRKPRKPKVPDLVPEPLDGSPADWFARGYEAGFVEGHANAIREVQQLAHRVRRTAETAALAAQAAEATDRDTVVLERALQDRYGQAARNSDKWMTHPAYRLGILAYGDRYGRKAPKAAETEPGPSLTLGDPPPPEEPMGDPEEEARRAAGQAWRA